VPGGIAMTEPRLTLDLQATTVAYLGLTTSISITFPVLMNELGITFRFSVLAALLPALAVAVYAILAVPRVRKRVVFPVSVYALLAWLALSLLWVDPTERGRGMIIFARLVAPLPLAFLIQDAVSRRRFAWSFLVGSAVTTAVVYFLHYGRWEGLTLGSAEYINRNDVACYYTLCIVVCMYLREQSNSSRRVAWTLPLMGLYAVTIVLTASRSGALALAGIAVILAVRTALNNRSWMLLLAPLMVAGVLAYDVSSLELSTRFSASSVDSLGGRTEIWVEASHAVDQDPVLLVRGSGLGGSSKILGRRWSDLDGARIDDLGISRKATHNSYMEMFLSGGGTAMLLATHILGVLLIRAVRHDRTHNAITFRVLIGFLILYGLVTTVWRSAYWTAIYLLASTLFSDTEEAD
jgi:hypothetical protein